MSRSGYSEDCDNLGLWRGAVERAIAGKRGQAFLREMVDALDAMPVKELVAGDIVRDGAHVCAIGSVALARKLDVSQLDITDGEDVGKAFGIARAMAQEIAFENDDDFRSFGNRETDAQRWARMRAWAVANLAPVPNTGENNRKAAIPLSRAISDVGLLALRILRALERGEVPPGGQLRDGSGRRVDWTAITNVRERARLRWSKVTEARYPWSACVQAQVANRLEGAGLVEITHTKLGREWVKHVVLSPYGREWINDYMTSTFRNPTHVDRPAGAEER